MGIVKPRSETPHLHSTKSWRRLAAWAMLVLSCALLLAGMLALEIDPAALASWIGQWPKIWGAPFLVVGVFTALAFLGAPQVVLISATLIAFGPIWGSGLSWCATMISASVGFWLGHWWGAERIARWSGPGLIGRIGAIVARNGLFSALIVRLIPTGPFALINAALGACGISYWQFFLGTAVGIAPKILLIAAFGQALREIAFGPQTWAAWMALVFIGLAGGGLIWLRSRRIKK